MHPNPSPDSPSPGGFGYLLHRMWTLNRRMRVLLRQVLDWRGALGNKQPPGLISAPQCCPQQGGSSHCSCLWLLAHLGTSGLCCAAFQGQSSPAPACCLLGSCFCSLHTGPRAITRVQGLAGTGSGSSLFYLLFLILQFCCCWILDTGITGPSSSPAQYETWFLPSPWGNI